MLTRLPIWIVRVSTDPKDTDRVPVDGATTEAEATEKLEKWNRTAEAEDPFFYDTQRNPRAAADAEPETAGAEGVAGRRPAPAPATTDRTLWAYEGGWFGTKDNRTWTEYGFNILNDWGRPFTFTEVGRTDAYVELYDAARKLTVRLSDTGATCRTDGGTEWAVITRGGWRVWGK